MALPFNLDLFPVTAVTVVAAIGVTAGWHLFKKDISFLIVNERAFTVDPWRLVTTSLPHGGLLHLFFNLYWLIQFGRKLEGRYGPAAMAGIICLTSAASIGAEWAFFHGGVGLSGVVYGLFGMLWMLSRLDDRELSGSMPKETVRLMVGWFFVCIVLTWANIWNIANVAHGVGCGIGVLLGQAVGVDPRRRIPWIAGLVVTCLWIYMLATWGRPYVNIPYLTR
jgi:membrane associated rhomboid family serine protease